METRIKECYRIKEKGSGHNYLTHIDGMNIMEVSTIESARNLKKMFGNNKCTIVKVILEETIFIQDVE